MIPENEMGVIVLFSQQALEAGYKIKSVGTTFPDVIVERDGIEYRGEFEYFASNFRSHRHDPRKCDLIICWKNDYSDSILPVLELSDANWKLKELELPTNSEREIAYWKQRALIAENKLRRQISDNKVSQDSSKEITPFLSQEYEELLKIVAKQADQKPFGQVDVQMWTDRGRTTAYSLISYGKSIGLLEQIGRGRYTMTSQNGEI